MLLTTALILSFFAMVLVAFLLWGCCLRLGLSLAKTRINSWQDIFSATAMSLAWGVFVKVAFRFLLPQEDEAVMLELLLEFAILVLGVLFIIHLKFQTSVISSVVAWLPTNLSGVVVLLFGTFIWSPFVFEAYMIPTSSMAPTLIGPNHQSNCPICNTTCKCTAWPNATPASFSPEPMICENFHISSHSDISSEVFGGDRFFAAKFLSPRRWDLLVFKDPKDPEQILVKRLVGLPGEIIHIENGVVHVDGSPIPFPEYMAGIKYQQIPNFRPPVHATADNPAQLADDELFVLGDFSVRAFDSRYWEQGSAGHAPYAVPKSHIIGVATHRFWPLDRMDVLWK